MRYSGLIRRDTDEPKAALKAYATLYNQFRTLTTVDRREDELPKSFTLLQNYPNPFNASTTITFSLPVSGFVILKIYDIQGKEVTTIVSESMPPGTHEYTWNAGDVASGIYLYQLQTDNTTETRKLLLVK